ncbi:MAG: TVP38/TMEM64 family protein, partial [Giesbergeria sp.]|nr:TVP38/TMEM64 family protein [Giesbergeria sp.]
MKNTKRLALLILVLVLVAGFFALGGAKWLTLEGLKSGMAQFAAWKDASPVLLGLAFAGVYVLVAALSLPGAAIMTLAAGAIFGLF